MTPRLDRDDIQGNVLLPYGRKTFAMGSLLLFHVKRPPAPCGSAGAEVAGARRFLQDLLPEITTARLHRSKRTRAWSASEDQPLPQAPPVAVNVAFTCAGLAAFGVPQTTLSGLPVEFQEGMQARAPLFHDDLSRWDPVWSERDGEAPIHLLILLRANVGSALAKAYRLQGIPLPQQPATADYHRRAIFEQARDLARGRLAHRRQRLIHKAEAMGLTLLAGHGPATETGTQERRWQDFESLTCFRDEETAAADQGDPPATEEERELRYSEIEHFGFFDGIADPVFQGQYPPEQEAAALVGQGKLIDGCWHPLATGEFLLGYPDEAREMPAVAVPLSFSRNGTFLVVRKLHQHVARFERTINAQVPAFQRWLHQGRSPAPDGAATTGEDDREEARQLLRAKLVGRWEDGTPLVMAPSYREWLECKATLLRLQAAARSDETAQSKLTEWKKLQQDLRYEPLDREGDRCPLTAHIRRSNPRDSGDPHLGEQPGEKERQRASSVLANRRRILRRGMAYGERWRPRSDSSDPLEACVDDGRERGTLFMALCSGLFRQFEFLQQQWINHGADFGAGNDVCPISGVMAPHDRSQGTKVIIGTAADSDRPPFVMRPREAVECRGGAYFFLPSLTAVRQIAQGMVDPA